VKLAKDMGAEDGKGQIIKELSNVEYNFDDYLVYDGPSEKHGEWVQSKVRGVQAAIVTVPLIQAYDEAYKSVKRGGRIIALALPKDNISVPPATFIMREIQLIGSFVGTRKDIQEALELAKLRQITCKVEKCKLEDINEVFENMRNFKISGRIVIDFTAK
jgi:propanol-preferring alcohol dehydrogenase